MKKGDQIRQPATGRLAEVVKRSGSQIYILDSCGTYGWYSVSQWEKIKTTPRAPTEAKLIRAMLESIVREADADHASEDLPRVLIRRTTIEGARKLLKLKSTRSTRRAKQ